MKSTLSSRLGPSRTFTVSPYIEVGKLTEEFFPEHSIRLVAVSDGIDTNEGENELVPIRNLFNEWYARDISNKRRLSNKIRGTSGEPLAQPPYG